MTIDNDIMMTCHVGYIRFMPISDLPEILIMAGLASSPNAVWPKEECMRDPQAPYMRKGHPSWVETA